MSAASCLGGSAAAQSRMDRLEARVAELEARLSHVTRPAAERPSITQAAPPPRLTVARILAETSAEFEIPVAELLSPWREQRLIPARHAAMWLARRMTKHSLPAIGRAMQRDHTVVRHGVIETERRMAADPAFAARVSALSERLQKGEIDA